MRTAVRDTRYCLLHTDESVTPTLLTDEQKAERSFQKSVFWCNTVTSCLTDALAEHKLTHRTEHTPPSESTCQFCDAVVYFPNPVCFTCRDRYQFGMRSGIPFGEINGLTYRVGGKKYWVSPYMTRHPTPESMNAGVWTEETENGNRFLEEVLSPPTPELKEGIGG
jgi:hypothetical protein